ncbi:hypothetical protein BMF94_4853 [Rhodotorula taiwanensis]|uniref:Mitochondrial carrier protein n=1 Tax=Rhodotorula taiwanensis TaxID=741276 RepID=A0A2S5B5Y8_9BASI|nr:hypothetical protein BMF94_4853 [Rhodotorula taiwanensis]
MSTSTTSDPLPVPALPSHHASPVETGFAGSVPGIGEYQHGELERRLRNEHELAAVVGRQAESHKQEESAIDLRGFAAGTASGLTKLVVGHPFDVIKVRLQCSPRGAYAGPWDCLKRTVQSEGPRALYKGLFTSSSFRDSTTFAAFWQANQADPSRPQYRIFIARIESGWPSGWRDDGSGKDKAGEANALKLSLPGHFISGLLAGQTVCFIACPTEHLKARLQMQMTGPKLYSGPIDCAKKIVAVKGWPGLWHGFGATLLFRSHMGTMFLSYELIQRAFKRYKPDMNPGTANFLSGGLASNAFWVSSFPFDAVKNRLMTDSLTNPKYKSWMMCARAMWAEGGARAFYHGFTPAILRAFPTNASALLVWESVMRVMGAEKI